MAVNNSAAVYIDGINYTSKLVLPVKLSFMLDESLDEAIITLKHVKKAVFQPLTPVEIRVGNNVAWQKKLASSESGTYYFVVASDAAEESPVGSGLYDHELALVEVTKIAECIVVDTNTVTNDIGRVYTDNQYPATEDIQNQPNDYEWNDVDGWDGY